MNCVEVRERLPERALGLLDGDAQWQVERHLEWCAGCRKESAELAQGVEMVSRGLPSATPRPVLEERVVHEVLMAAGKRPRGARRRTVRALAAATLAAAMLAMGAVGWGFAERQKARDTQAEVDQALTTKEGLAALVATFQQDLQTKGTVYQADLYPGLGRQPAGTVVVFAAPAGGRGFALVRVVTPLPAAGGPFSVVLVDRDGHVIHLADELELRQPEGDHVLADLDLRPDLSRPSPIELAHLTGVNVVSKSGATVLTGTFRVS
jgi:hypothetical protein